jgi:hypothetical protein
MSVHLKTSFNAKKRGAESRNTAADVCIFGNIWFLSLI